MDILKKEDAGLLREYVKKDPKNMIWIDDYPAIGKDGRLTKHDLSMVPGTIHIALDRENNVFLRGDNSTTFKIIGNAKEILK